MWWRLETFVMWPRLSLWLVVGTWWGAVHAAAPVLPGPAFPTFANAAAMNAACQRGLAGARVRVKALEKRRPDAGWLAASDDLNAFIEDAYYPISVLGNLHPDKALRDAAQACDLKWQDFSSSLGLNEKLYRVARRVQARDDIDREALRNTLEGFEDAGVALPAAQRPKAKKLADRITALGLDFDKNIRDATTRVAFTEAELKGVPDSVWKEAPRDGEGRLLLGLDYPSYLPVVQYAEDAAARERMWRAKSNEGGEANLKLLAEMIRLRREYAQLFGFSNYADFTLRRRMAQDLRHASSFLDEVKAAVTAGEQRDLVELRAAKAAHLGRPEAVLHRWDVAFYSERVKRERYSVDQNQFRAYFPPQESLRFVMALAERLFRIRYTRVEATLWHPEVQAYAVSDAQSGKPLAGLLIDLYPREGKYNHAAVWSYRNSSTRNGRVPQAALVVNFDRQGLTLDELETLLHEFGHAVHNNLSATRYTAQAGTSTLRDFSEAPSQMLEDWVYDKDVLALFRQVCPTCKPVPDELLAKAVLARDFGKPSAFSRQHLFASYDLALHSAEAGDPMATWARMEGETPLGHVPGTMFPAGFGHIAGGYAAGYYGYLWSLVVAMDLRTAFAADKLDPAVGGRYRHSILANGGQRPPQDLVREFLGRPSNSKAFYDYLKQ
jgi:thimet oligopeptidase